MTNTTISVDVMLSLVQKLRQEKAGCEESISQTRHKAMVLERRVDEMARQVGAASTAREAKMAKLAAVKGRVEARQKTFDQVKQGVDVTQATVKECMERVEGEARERFGVVGEFEEEMMKLSEKMSKHSLVCTVTRLRNTLARMEEEEQLVDGRLVEVQGRGENMMRRKANSETVAQMNGWKEVVGKSGQLVSEVAGMCEVARGRVEEVKGDISLLVEKRNTILMSNN